MKTLTKPRTSRESKATLPQARAAKAAMSEHLRSIAPDAAVGLTRMGKGYAVKVNFRTPLAPQTLKNLQPKTQGEVPVLMETVGKISKS